MSNEPSVKVMSKRLPRALENVCLTMDEDCQMYAVGSKVTTLTEQLLQCCIIGPH